ncbi:RNA polymerase sigma factor [Antarcticibacterium flavum]|uniref:RNA polymerase sigma factor n=1 Tax=Antarcticibacterium flavum TaxID=2058175 RepID=A0A5B7X359_9FLAO|nr:RNA polymerase sigma factor [Antarcticibacterium flavum]MCM4161546.1 RNA polymerase subunit sigma-70 [Antarcticibacterium sp. W02-3]QCY69984.1 RNA polymerase sigma factor [Antarcticibacterium flavum]
MGLKKLIAQCKKQDRKAQEELYNTYAGKFFTLCLKYSTDYEQARDTLQDGFIKIFQNIDQFNGRGTFEGWMTRIIINTAIKKYEKKDFHLTIYEEQLEDPEVEIDDEIVSSDFLMQIIRELPERYRLVFNLYSMDGFTHKEIAKLLNITEGTSKSNLARARLKLKEQIEAHQQRKSVKGL